MQTFSPADIEDILSTNQRTRKVELDGNIGIDTKTGLPTSSICISFNDAMKIH